MRRQATGRFVSVTAIGAVVASAVVWAVWGTGFGQERRAQPAGAPGMAILASGVGSTYSVESMGTFVGRTGVPLVVVDWAWITAHFDRTDFDKVNELVAALQAKGVEVAAMYRPRFLGEATVPIQVKEDGSPVFDHGREICFSSAEARQWGIAWGEKILERCPALSEIIIYNPRNHCQCPDCAKACEADPFAHYAAIWQFLAEARTAWRAVQPTVKLGVVFVADPEFWSRGADTVDVARPFLFVTEEADLPKDMAAARAVGDALPGRMGACLAKITWAPDAKVTPERLAEFDRLADQSGLPYFFWTFDTLILSELYDPAAVAQALGIDRAALTASLAAMRGAPRQAEPEGKRYTASQIENTEAEVFFTKLARPEEGFNRFAAMWALMHKARTSDEETARGIVDRAIQLIQNPAAPFLQRWQCLYVAADTRDERAIPIMADVLRGDPNEIVRGVAACALGRFESPEAIAALEAAAQNETSQRVLGSVNKALGGGFLNTGGPPPLADEGAEGDISVEEVLRGRQVGIVLVKDFMRMENSGPAVRDVEFGRYFPAVSDEQLVVARWVTALSDGGEEIPVSVARVFPDSGGNLIHTYHLDHFPANDQVLVTVTSLVAHRPGPAPQGAFSIPEPEGYPAEVRPYLSATEMVAVHHPEIRAEAEEILAETDDAYGVALELARRMRRKGYKPNVEWDRSLPTAVFVLRHGGSCCASAVSAAAILRACGIPTQLTYVPAGYVHGIVQFYLNGYGWVRMDATCGTGRLPLVQEAEHLGLVRLFDTPIRMEAQPGAYAWPYQHNDEEGRYEFRAAGRPCAAVRFTQKGEADADGVRGRVKEPFPHLECGSWHTVLGAEPAEGAWQEWDALAEASRAAVVEGRLGEFEAVTARLPGLGRYVAEGRDFGKSARPG